VVTRGRAGFDAPFQGAPVGAARAVTSLRLMCPEMAKVGLYLGLDMWGWR
jgi:hypothetical protein